MSTMIPRWIVDSSVTKRVALHVALWAIGCGAATWAAIVTWARTAPLPALLIAAVGTLLALLGSHFSTKKLRSIEVPADWVR